MGSFFRHFHGVCPNSISASPLCGLLSTGIVQRVVSGAGYRDGPVGKGSSPTMLQHGSE